MPSPRRSALLLGILASLPACGDDGRASGSASDPTTATQPTTISDPSAVTVEPTTSDLPTGTTAGPTTVPGTDTGTSDDPNTTDPTITSADSSSSGDATSGAPCVNLECQIPVCPNGTTTLKGVVYAPEGTLPLYNVVVYVPNAAVDPIPDGVTCDTCQTGLSGEPIVAALSDTTGEFVLEGVPAGADIPLVITVGKWRREVTSPTSCPASTTRSTPDLTRLPRTRARATSRASP
jgi:hypothetical protein